MKRSRGATAIAGFNYQHIYAGWRVVTLLKARTLQSAVFEGDEDLELHYTDGNVEVREFVQVKTREEGQPHWSIAEFARKILLPMFQQNLHRRDVTIARFLTTGDADQNLAQFRDDVLIPLQNDPADAKARESSLLQDLKQAVLRSGKRRNPDFDLSDPDFEGLIKRLRITTRHPEAETLRQLTQTRVSELGVEKGDETAACDALFTRISDLSGKKKLEHRVATARDLSDVLGIPFLTAQESIQSLHQFKEPAEAWYIHRPEEDDLSSFISDVSRGLSKNLLVTGPSGIGKSSFLNFGRTLADAEDVFSVKMRVFDTRFDSFLLQLVDSIIDQFEAIGVHDNSRRMEHPKNRLLSVLKSFRSLNKSTPVILMIDQFERLFEESRVRIDESLMRDVWRRFMEIASEVNQLGKISFVITAREHFFWIMFPSDIALVDSNFRYVKLRQFNQADAAVLLDRLLDIAQCSMTDDARELFLEKTDREPQVIALAFVNAFGNRTDDTAMDFAELTDLAPWDEVFKKDIDAVCRDELQKLVIFAMANIERELCDVDEIHERVVMVRDVTQKRVRDALFEIQNTHQMINQPREGKFSFYHRKVGECIFRDYSPEFPEEWVDEGVIWDIHKMLAEQVRNFEKLGTLLGKDHLRIVNNHRDRLDLDESQLELIVKSSFLHDEHLDYWLPNHEKAFAKLADFYVDNLENDNQTVQVRAVQFLGRFGSPEHLASCEQLLSIDVESTNWSEMIRTVAEKHRLIVTTLEAMLNADRVPTSKPILSQWLFAAMLCLQDAKTFISASKVATRLVGDIFLEQTEPNRYGGVEFLSRSADEKAFGLNTTANLARAVVHVDRPEQRQMLVNYGCVLIEKSKERYHSYRAAEHLEVLQSNLSKHYRFWARRLFPTPLDGSLEEVGKASKLVANGFAKYSDAVQSLFLESMKNFRNKEKKAITGPDGCEFLRHFIHCAEIRKDKVTRTAQKQLVRLLDKIGDVNALTEAIGVLEALRDEPAIEKLCPQLGSMICVETSDNDKTAVIERSVSVSTFGIGVLKRTWELFQTIVESTAEDTRFGSELHEKLIALQSTLLSRRIASGDSICIDELESLKQSSGNACLCFDLIGNYLVALKHADHQLPKTVLEDSIYRYESIKTRLHEDIEPGRFMFKAAVFKRVAAICEWLEDETKTREFLMSARTAYRHAGAHFSEIEDKYDEYGECQKEQILLLRKIAPDAPLAAELKDIYSWELCEIANRFLDKGDNAAFVEVVEHTIEDPEDTEALHEYAPGWFEIFVKQRNWLTVQKLIEVMQRTDTWWDNEDQFSQTLTNEVCRQELDKEAIAFVDKMISESNWRTLHSLGTGFSDNGDHARFLKIAQLLFSDCDDDWNLPSALADWWPRLINGHTELIDQGLEKVSELRYWHEFFDEADVARLFSHFLDRHYWKSIPLCIDMLQSSDDWWEYQEEYSQKIVTAYLSDTNDAAKSKFLNQLFSNQDWYVLRSIGVAFADAGDHERVTQIARRVFADCNDHYDMAHVASTWLRLAIGHKDLELARLCWKNLHDYDDWDEFFDGQDVSDLIGFVLRESGGKEVKKLVSNTYDTIVFELAAEVLRKNGDKQTAKELDDMRVRLLD